MSSSSSIWGLQYNYSGSFGDADKEAVRDPLAGRHEVGIIDEKMSEKEMGAANEAKGFLKGLGLNDNQIRDMHLDYSNPRAQLPPDVLSIKHAELIPNFNQVMIDLLTKEDYEQQDQVKLVQDSNVNFMNQSALYTDPKLAGKDEYNSDKVGKGERGAQSKQYLEFNNPTATGAQTYFLDDQSNRMNVIDNSSMAF